MFSLIIILALIVAALLIVVILLQASKGTGLAGSAFGGSSAAVLGVRRTADFLSKTTTILALVLAILCVLSNYMIPRETSDGTDSFIDRAQKTTTAPASAPSSTPSQTPPAENK